MWILRSHLCAGFVLCLLEIVSVVNARTTFKDVSAKFSNTDFCLKFLPSKDGELVRSKIKKKRWSPTSFWREHAGKNTQIWVNWPSLVKKATVAASPKILQLELWSEMFSAIRVRVRCQYSTPALIEYASSYIWALVATTYIKSAFPRPLSS